MTPLHPGSRLGPYEILAFLGAGGMGEVYRARHEKLRREVALKVLPPRIAADRVGLARFEREARTASALNHPNIVTIYDIGEHGGLTYIAMELVAGATLRELVSEGPLPVDRLLEVAVQLADGLAKAHAAGIVHRDIKSANVMVTDDGLVKVLDFGLAKSFGPERPERADPTITRPGRAGAGTPHYMAPEQWSGGTVDHRSDQFALGVILYEMACGARPFDGPTIRAVMTAALTEPAPGVRRLRPDVPRQLDRIIARCLAKDPDARYPETTELLADLRALRDRRSSAGIGVGAALRRPALAIPSAVLVVVAVVGGGAWVGGSERRWAEREAAAEVEALVEEGELYEAYRQVRRALEELPDDPELTSLLDRITLPARVETDPPGAEVWARGYDTPDAPYELLGRTPLSLRVPYALMRLKITKDGYEPFEGAPFGGGSLRALASGLELDSAGGGPEGMVRIPAGVLSQLRGIHPRGEGPVARLGTYYLGRYEVTNREFQEFVRDGGYATSEWWPSELERSGEPVSWQEALRRFRDETGRPGPSVWQLGRYPEGEGDHPVGGISWYEAAAYCTWAGRSLPTIYHWSHAIGQAQLSDILRHSNIGGVSDGPAPVGSHPGLAAYGTYDMAGNMKEWAWNGTGELRYVLGAAWNEPGYLFRAPIGEDPWSREPTNGVRCASYTDPPTERLLAPVDLQVEPSVPEPLDDAAFELIRSLYDYDRDSLDARVEAVDDTLPDYRWETVSFNTAYDNERMEVHLLIPHDAVPPYQSVIWFPGGDVFSLRSSDHISSSFLVDFIPRTGRVLVHPVYYGMYERFEAPLSSPLARRDAIIRWAKDVRRTVDYLETRPDFDASKIAYYGFSSGAGHGPIYTAVEPRIATAIYLGGGFPPEERPAEVDVVHFLPRSHTPTLMINGRDDFLLPYEDAQRPFLELLGVPPADKRHERLPGGHIPERVEIVREVLDWLDQRLGPVRGSAGIQAGSR